MNNRTYAREVTKEYLQKLGVEHVSTDAKEIIVNGQAVTPVPTKNSKKGDRLYYNVRLYDKDTDTFYEAGIHVLNYVWNNSDKPQGLVIDHIDNDADNNDISNLQCITPSENVAKDRSNWNVREIKCQLDKPRSFYETRLEGYMMAYEQAKQDHDAEAAHHFRTNIAQTRARLRYYDSHIEEARAVQIAQEQEAAARKAYHERAKKKKELQYNVDRAREIYKQVRNAYGPNDEYVKKMWGEWKLAIAVYHGFLAENKVDAQ
jgi:hypothetical protein